jgi:recombination protein RecR
MSLEKLVHELAKLPAIGEKTALRLALHILRQPADYAQSLAHALQDTVGKVSFCDVCCNLAVGAQCEICRDPRRDKTVICVVEDVADLMAIEKTHAFKGTYHVLHGSLSPIDGIGPDELRIPQLLARFKITDESTEVPLEIILATNPNVNGDATALYLSRLLKPFGVSLTKLASGIPIGGHIEYIDQNTLSRALERRAAF